MIEITVFAKSDGPLTKQISLNADGTVKSDGSKCVMPSGTARRFPFSTMRDVSELIVVLRPNEAIATGGVIDDSMPQ